MSDKYRNFEHLAKNEVAGVDYQIRSRNGGTTLVLAPHGGGIEPGTSELTEAIAADDRSFYIFDGMKQKGNGDLHITSTHFDEPTCLDMLVRSDVVLAIHGEGSQDVVVFVGGLDADRVASMRTSFAANGFVVRDVDNPDLEGKASGNVCNRGRRRAGVQLEIAEGLRRRMFRKLTPRSERQYTTSTFDRFVAAARDGLA